MTDISRRLLWQLLFFRLVSSQKRLFLFAIITVSLGVALALGIRLGTESATRSLEQTLPLNEDPLWSEPLTAQSSEAFTFVRNVALRHPVRVFSVLETQAVREGLWGEQSTSLQLVFPWSSGDGPRSESCAQEFSRIKVIKIAGRNFSIPRASLISFNGSTNNCRTALLDTSKLTENSELQIILDSELKKAPMHIMFRKSTPDEQKSFEDIKQIAMQVAGIDFSSEQKRIDRLKDVTRSFRTNLQLMGFIALFIGFALVHHIFSLLIARQGKTLATLSALGIPRRRQIQVLLTLSGCLGLIASCVGTVLGLISGAFLSWVTSSTVRNLYESFVDATHFYWHPVELLYGFLLGFSACFLGSLHPIVRIRSLPVAQIMRDGSFESHQTGLTRREAGIFAFILTIISIGLLRWTIVWNRIPITALAACLGFLIVSALLAQLIAHSLYSSARLQSSSRRWAKNLRLFMPPQAAVIVQVLTLTFTLTFGVKGMAESFRRTVADWAQSALRADLWIRSVGGTPGSLPESLLQRLETARKSEAVAIDSLTVLPAALRLTPEMNAKPVLFANARMEDQAQVTPMRLLAPTGDDKSRQAELAQAISDSAKTCAGTAEDPCLAYISEPVQVHFGLQRPLDSILCPDIQFRRICFRIIAVYQDFGSDQGVILSDQRVYERLTGERLRPTFANVYLPPMASGKKTQLETDLRHFAQTSEGSLGFETLAELQSRILETFDNTFRVTDALYVLCGIIAIIATVSSLNMQILLRRREWNIQWALGVSEKRLSRRFAVWSSLMAALAAGVSVVGGIVLSAVLVYTVNYYSFGYSLSLSIPWHLPVIVLIVAALSGYFSGLMQKKSISALLSPQAFMQE